MVGGGSGSGGGERKCRSCLVVAAAKVTLFFPELKITIARILLATRSSLFPTAEDLTAFKKACEILRVLVSLTWLWISSRARCSLAESRGCGAILKWLLLSTWVVSKSPTLNEDCVVDSFVKGSHQSMGVDMKVAKSGSLASVMVVLREGRREAALASC